MSCYLIKTDRQLNYSQLLSAVLKVFLGSITPVRHKVDGVLSQYLHYLKQHPNKQTTKKTRKTSIKPLTSKQLPTTPAEVDEEECQDKALQRIEQLKREWVPELVKQNNNGKNTATG